MRRDELLKKNPHVEHLRLRKQKVIIRWIVFIVTILLVLFVGIGLLSRLSKFSITDVSVIGTRVIENEVIQTAVKDELSGNYALIYSKKNILIYPKKKILNLLKQSFPRIQNISIEQKGFHDLIVTIDERMGVSLWCGKNFPEPTENQCYFVDEKGYIFAQAPYFSGTVYFKWYGPIEGINTIGSQVISYYGFENMAGFIQKLRVFNLDPHALVRNQNGSYTVLLGRSNGSDIKLLFSEKYGTDTILETLAAGFDIEPLSSLVKNDFPNITYIDARYEGKIYYK